MCCSVQMWQASRVHLWWYQALWFTPSLQDLLWKLSQGLHWSDQQDIKAPPRRAQEGPGVTRGSPISKSGKRNGRRVGGCKSGYCNLPVEVPKKWLASGPITPNVSTATGTKKWLELRWAYFALFVPSLPPLPQILLLQVLNRRGQGVRTCGIPDQHSTTFPGDDGCPIQAFAIRPANVRGL